MAKAVIYGLLGNETHDNLVRDAFILGYNDSGGSISESDCEVYSIFPLNISLAYQKCVDSDSDVLIHSYGGASSKIESAYLNSCTATLFMGAGSNTPSDLQFDYSIPQSLVSTGAGDTENETAINVEFISSDPIESDDQDYSSYSNGYIAGQIKYISDQRNCSIWVARYCARVTGSESGVWDSNNGYGFIDTALAIAYSGEIVENPFCVELNYTLEATRSGVKLTFNLTGSKTIYRKTSYETSWTEIATITSDVYIDSVSRSPKKIFYKVEGIENDILFTKINKLYERNIQ